MMSTAHVPEAIYEPFGGARLVAARVIAILQLAVLILLDLFVVKDGTVPLLVGGATFIFCFWVGWEVYALLQRRWRRMVFLTGEECEAVVVSKLFATRGGYYRLVIEFAAGGKLVRTSAAVDDRYAAPVRIGDRLKIRYLPQSPTWWVPSGV